MALMYDSVNGPNIPANAAIVGGYDDGNYAWPPEWWNLFPNAQHVHITVLGDPSSQVFDYETGNAEGAMPNWATGKLASGQRPTVYCNSSTWQQAIDALSGVGVTQTQVDWWIANYSDGPTIPAGAEAIQYSDPGPYDLTQTNGVWPRETPPAPPLAPPPPLVGLEKPVSGRYGTLNAPVVAICPTPSGNGYTLVGADGGTFNYGDAPMLGSLAGKPLNAPIVDATHTADGNGLIMVGTDGGVFCFGDAQFYGSMGGKALVAPVISIALTPSGAGYWLIAADGGVFAFGDAPFEGTPA